MGSKNPTAPILPKETQNNETISGITTNYLKVISTLTEEQKQASIKALNDIMADKDTVSKINEKIRKIQEQERKAKENPIYARYEELYNSLPVDQQKNMKDNLKITSDGKLEVVEMKKKFSILTAEPNNETIFDGSHVDKNNKTGIPGVKYFTGREAEKQAKKQKKGLLKDKAEVDKFISYFPGKDGKEKIYNFVKLFGLEKTGYWDPDSKKWNDVGAIGYVVLSEVNKDDNVYEVRWLDDYAGIDRVTQIYPVSCVSCEDCT